MDLKKIKSIIKLVEDSSVQEVSVEEGDFAITVSKQSSLPPAGQATPQVVATPTQAQVPAPPAASPASAESQGDPSTGAPASSGHVQTSPIVGTYYEAASPDSDPFITQGCSVKKGDTICIVEAMKIMNEIEAEMDGVIEAIHTANGQAVEFDQPLVTIKPTS
ncbi:MAG: acetyl-CoA carboxylase biotin carboxyl carrier protein [Balneolaceae bacterium]|nr:acetyl-CoA carboxylase biotin carboxyl carrier protein [Balneolaceae bacterium]